VDRPAHAQSIFGSIVGVTQDSSLLVVPETAVTARNLEENTTQAAVSDAKGIFRFVNLKPGRYEIVAARPSPLIWVLDGRGNGPL
jgi:hypothetical protein